MASIRWKDIQASPVMALFDYHRKYLDVVEEEFGIKVKPATVELSDFDSKYVELIMSSQDISSKDKHFFIRVPEKLPVNTPKSFRKVVTNLAYLSGAITRHFSTESVRNESTRLLVLSPPTEEIAARQYFAFSNEFFGLFVRGVVNDNYARIVAPRHPVGADSPATVKGLNLRQDLHSFYRSLSDVERRDLTSYVLNHTFEEMLNNRAPHKSEILELAARFSL